MKKTMLTIMVILLMGCLWTPMCYAEEAESITINVLPFEEGLEDDFDENDEEGEEDILPPSDEEYVIDSVTLPWYEYDEGELTTRSILSRSIGFKKTAANKALANVNLKTSSNITKLKVTIALQKKSGSTYKSTGKTAAHQANNREITCRTNFAVEKSPAYRIKVTVKEYEGSTMKSKTIFYKGMNRNGY